MESPGDLGVARPARRPFEELFEDGAPAADPAPPPGSVGGDAEAELDEVAAKSAVPTTNDIIVEPSVPQQSLPVIADPDQDPSAESGPDGGRKATAEPVAVPSAKAGRLYHSADFTAGQALGARPARRDGAPERQAKPAPATPSARSLAIQRSSGAGVTYLGVMLLTLLPTLSVGFAQALVLNRLDWLTGATLLLMTVVAALVVRPADLAAPIVAPPLAYLATVLTAGQLTLAEQGSFALREGLMLFRSLSDNALWVIASSVIAALIVLTRWYVRRRAPRPSAAI